MRMPLPRKPSCGWKVGNLGSEAPVLVSATIFGWRPVFLAAARNCQPTSAGSLLFVAPQKERGRGYTLSWRGLGWMDASGVSRMEATGLPLPPFLAGCRCSMLCRPPARYAVVVVVDDDDDNAYGRKCLRRVCPCVCMSLIRRHVGEGRGP